jgi:hypothetical protein
MNLESIIWIGSDGRAVRGPGRSLLISLPCFSLPTPRQFVDLPKKKKQELSAPSRLAVILSINFVVFHLRYLSVASHTWRHIP